MAVSVLVNNLYTTFARAMGLWSVRCMKYPFLQSSIVKLVFQEASIFLVFIAMQKEHK